MKHYKVYTPFPSGDMYLGDNGTDLIVEANSPDEALQYVVSWIFDTSKYSEELTTKWLEEHPLIFTETNV